MYLNYQSNMLCAKILTRKAILLILLEQIEEISDSFSIPFPALIQSSLTFNFSLDFDFFSK